MSIKWLTLVKTVAAGKTSAPEQRKKIQQKRKETECISHEWWETQMELELGFETGIEMDEERETATE